MTTTQTGTTPTESIICAHCFGPIHGKPVWRNGRPYHRPTGPIHSPRAGGCAAADRLITRHAKPAKVHADQLQLDNLGGA